MNTSNINNNNLSLYKLVVLIPSNLTLGLIGLDKEGFVTVEEGIDTAKSYSKESILYIYNRIPKDSRDDILIVTEQDFEIIRAEYNSIPNKTQENLEKVKIQALSKNISFGNLIK